VYPRPARRRVAVDQIAGASTPEQIRDNAKAVDVVLTPEDLNLLDNSLPTIPGGAVGAVELRDQLR
jgi:aryl-alcohol dehydrogenase-like predicted oxidoreductase